MSLVGPRPIIEEEIPRYGDKILAYMTVRPGLTGLWQVSGRSNCTYEERVALDARYISEWRLRTDFVILLRTVPVLLQPRWKLLTNVQAAYSRNRPVRSEGLGMLSAAQP